MSEPLLLVRGLQVPIGAQTVLRGIDLQVEEQGITCVLGSNGVGKTTLMRTLSGIYRNATGTVRFGGTDILNRSPHEIVAAGISEQDFVFHDARELIGARVELYERLPRVVEHYDAVRRAAEGWDGSDPLLSLAEFRARY